MPSSGWRSSSPSPRANVRRGRWPRSWRSSIGDVGQGARRLARAPGAGCGGRRGAGGGARAAGRHRAVAGRHRAAAPAHRQRAARAPDPRRPDRDRDAGPRPAEDDRPGDRHVARGRRALRRRRRERRRARRPLHGERRLRRARGAAGAQRRRRSRAPRRPARAPGRCAIASSSRDAAAAVGLVRAGARRRSGARRRARRSARDARGRSGRDRGGPAARGRRGQDGLAGSCCSTSCRSRLAGAADARRSVRASSKTRRRAPRRAPAIRSGRSRGCARRCRSRARAPGSSARCCAWPRRPATSPARCVALGRDHRRGRSPAADARPPARTCGAACSRRGWAIWPRPRDEPRGRAGADARAARAAAQPAADAGPPGPVRRGRRPARRRRAARRTRATACCMPLYEIAGARGGRRSPRRWQRWLRPSATRRRSTLPRGAICTCAWPRSFIDHCQDMRGADGRSHAPSRPIPGTSPTLSRRAELQRRRPDRRLVDTLVRLAAEQPDNLDYLREAADVAAGPLADESLALDLLATAVRPRRASAGATGTPAAGKLRGRRRSLRARGRRDRAACTSHRGRRSGRRARSRCCSMARGCACPTSSAGSGCGAPPS